MPKRKVILDKIAHAAKAANIAFTVQREGGNHTIYNLDGVMITISRHANIDGHLAIKVYKQCEPKLGKGWWR